jgi:hypothetical protein
LALHFVHCDIEITLCYLGLPSPSNMATLIKKPLLSDFSAKTEKSQDFDKQEPPSTKTIHTALCISFV